MRRLCQLSIALLLVLSLASCGKGSTGERWTAERANAWYAELPWMAGCDYITSDAINQIEMWSAETYNAAQIDKDVSTMFASTTSPDSMLGLTEDVQKNGEAITKLLNDLINMSEEEMRKEDSYENED